MWSENFKVKILLKFIFILKHIMFFASLHLYAKLFFFFNAVTIP